MTKTWLITGCSTGFGRLLARAALERDDRVVAIAREPGSLSDIARAFADTARAVALDVTKAGDAETPPLHLPLGPRAYALAGTKIADFTRDIDAWEAEAIATDFNA